MAKALMAKAPEIESCREKPSCGGAVLDRREHRRWHERVFISEDSTVKRAGGPRYLGDPDPIYEQGDEGVAGG